MQSDEGGERERWLAYQTGSATVIAIVLVWLGGILGQSGWRTPFLVYCLGFAMPPLLLAFTWDPRRSALPASGSAALAEPLAMDRQADNFRWSNLFWICAITVFASSAYFMIIVQIGFILVSRGYTSPKLIGIAAATSQLANPVGAVLFRVMRLPIAGKLAMSFGISAAGFLVLGMAHSYAITVAGAALNGLGSGII